MNIVSFALLSTDAREAAADILLRALAHVPSAWKTMEDSRAEIAHFVGNPERLAFAACERASVLGWVGAIRQSEHAWELHPMAVAPERQRSGIGRRLIERLEHEARMEGVTTIWLGTDDDFGGTNIFGKDVYADISQAIARLAATAGHPFAFYRRMGYTITGLLPDVDGPGRHDILMAKRLVASGRSK